MLRNRISTIDRDDWLESKEMLYKLKQGQNAKKQTETCVMKVKNLKAYIQKFVISESDNLTHLQDGDKLKIVPIAEGAEDKEERSGDMVLLTKSPDVASSVTFAPVEDSYNSLVASEGGDDIEDEELKERFIDYYMNLDEDGDSIVMKEGSIITMVDENNKQLDFIVSHIGECDEDEEESDEGTMRFCFCFVFVLFTFQIGNFPTSRH